MKNYISYILLFFTLTLHAEVLTFESDTESQSSPFTLLINTDTKNEIEISFSLSEIEFVETSTDSQLWTPLINGFTTRGDIGTPALPRRTINLAIPTLNLTDIEIISYDYEDIKKELVPASKIEDTSKINSSLLPIEPDYTYDSHPIIEAEGIQNFRNNANHYFTICPILYDNQSHTVRIIKNLNAKINYSSANQPIKLKKSNPAFDITNNDLQINDAIIANPTNLTFTSDRTEDILIITYTGLLPEVKKYCEWKETLGFRTHVFDTEYKRDIPLLRNVIKEYYEREDINLNYLVFFGQSIEIESENVHTCIPYEPYATYIDDDKIGFDYTITKFGCINDTLGFVPDVHIGRIPMNVASEPYIDSLIAIEQNPIRNSDAFKDIFLTGKFYADNTKIREEWNFICTLEDCANYLAQKGYNIQRIYTTDNDVFPSEWSFWNSKSRTFPDYLKRPNYAWNGNSNDIIDAINNGAFLGIYNGHGGCDRWVEPLFIFNEESRDRLHNKYGIRPLILSMCCCSASPKYNNNLAYFWSSSAKGASAVIASSGRGWTGLQDILITGIIDALFPNPGLRVSIGSSSLVQTKTPICVTVGEILTQGLARITEQLGVSFHTKYMYKGFHILGDPTHMVQTAPASTFMRPTIKRTDSQISVSLKDIFPRAESNKVFVSFKTLNSDDPNIKRYKYTGASISYDVPKDKIVQICLSSPNRVPLIQKVYPFPSLNNIEKVEYNKSTRNIRIYYSVSDLTANNKISIALDNGRYMDVVENPYCDEEHFVAECTLPLCDAKLAFIHLVVDDENAEQYVLSL